MWVSFILFRWPNHLNLPCITMNFTLLILAFTCSLHGIFLFLSHLVTPKITHRQPMMKACKHFVGWQKGSRSQTYTVGWRGSQSWTGTTSGCFESLPASCITHSTGNWRNKQLCWYANWSLCPGCSPGWWCCQDTWTPTTATCSSSGFRWTVRGRETWEVEGQTARILVLLLHGETNPRTESVQWPRYFLQSIHDSLMSTTWLVYSYRLENCLSFSSCSSPTCLQDHLGPTVGVLS